MPTGADISLSQAFPTGSRVNERGRVEVGGCDLVELAAEFGTPAYIVDESDLRRRARRFRAAAEGRRPDSAVLFATKAFPCTAVLRALREEGLGCEVASGGELALALAAGLRGPEISFHGNAKSEGELRDALRARVAHIVLDSFDDLERVERIAASMGVGQDVLVRLTPDVQGPTHAAISTGQADSKFGLGPADAAAAIARAREARHLTVVGLHCHIGSQLLTLAPFEAAVAALGPFGAHSVYNLGGGLGVAYRSGESAPAVEDYVDGLMDAADRHLPAEARILIEPGRSLVANTTVTLYTVQTVKRNVSTWVAVDGGMSDNLRPMLYGARYEAVNVERPLEQGQPCNLVGKHCESGDVLVHDARLPAPASGDLVVTPSTGAYGHAMANNYNGVPRPPVIFAEGGNARVVVRRERHEDLMSRDLPA